MALVLSVLIEHNEPSWTVRDNRNDIAAGLKSHPSTIFTNLPSVDDSSINKMNGSDGVNSSLLSSSLRASELPSSTIHRMNQRSNFSYNNISNDRRTDQDINNNNSNMDSGLYYHQKSIDGDMINIRNQQRQQQQMYSPGQPYGMSSSYHPSNSSMMMSSAIGIQSNQSSMNSYSNNVTVPISRSPMIPIAGSGMMMMSMSGSQHNSNGNMKLASSYSDSVDDKSVLETAMQNFSFTERPSMQREESISSALSDDVSNDQRNFDG